MALIRAINTLGNRIVISIDDFEPIFLFLYFLFIVGVKVEPISNNSEGWGGLDHVNDEKKLNKIFEFVTNYYKLK